MPSAELAQHYKVKSVPTFVLFEREEKWRKMGVQTEELNSKPSRLCSIKVLSCTAFFMPNVLFVTKVIFLFLAPTTLKG